MMLLNYKLLNTKHVYLTNTCLILATAVITQYLRNPQNIQLFHYLQICKIHLVTQPGTLSSHPDQFEIEAGIFQLSFRITIIVYCGVVTRFRPFFLSPLN